MKKMSYLFSILAIVVSSTCSAAAAIDDSGNVWYPTMDITSKIPTITKGNKMSNTTFNKVPDHAQYAQADWSHAVGIAYGISEDEAMQIAKSNPKVTYFFRTKGFQMILNKPDGSYRRFGKGDTVFFSGTGKPHFGTAPGLADAYVKQ